MGKKRELKWYSVQYYDGRNSMTYKTPIKAFDKVDAIYRMFGTKKEIKANDIKKIRVTLFK